MAYKRVGGWYGKTYRNLAAVDIGGGVGSGGCNNISGSYTAKGGDLIFGPLMVTEMACAEKQMAQEAKLLSLLKGKVSTRYTVNGDLILTNESGQRATFRQVI